MRSLALLIFVVAVPLFIAAAAAVNGAEKIFFLLLFS